MADILLLENRVRNTIQLGESHFREFKSAYQGSPGNRRKGDPKVLCGYIGKAVVAFANADGGELLIGVDDDGTITGVPHDESVIRSFLQAPETHVHPGANLPLIEATKLILDGCTVLFFSVSKGTTEIYQLPNGRCVRRKDKSTIPAAFREIQFERREVVSREYDQQFVDAATTADLDLNLLQPVADQYLTGLSPEGYLQQIGLAQYASNGLRLRRAALLLFAADISRWHPRCQVRILKVEGTELLPGENYNVSADETVQGNILTLLRTSWEHLRPYLAYTTQFGTDTRFSRRYIYPELACREALVNAITHRDYSIQGGIDIFVYSDRLELKSPGALLSTLSISELVKLQGAHESRNSFVAKVLRENEYIRELGEGMRRIFQLMEKSELNKPQLYSNTLWFSVALPSKTIYSEREEAWLKAFDRFNLSADQKKIVLLGVDDREFSTEDIHEALNSTDRDIHDQAVIPLRKSDILIRTRSKNAEKSYAAENQIEKNKVPKYRVAIPDST